MNLSIINKKRKIFSGAIGVLLMMSVFSGCRSTTLVTGYKLAKADLQTQPAWSSHSNMLAFYRDLGFGGPVYIYRVAELNKPRLLIKINNGKRVYKDGRVVEAINSFDLLNLRWSPDDKHLLAEGAADGIHGDFAQVFAIKTGKQLLHFGDFRGSNFYWLDNDHIFSKDGNSIVYFSLKNGTRQVKPSGNRSLITKLTSTPTADNGRTIIISGAHWRGKGSKQKYIPGTVRAATLSPTKLKLGKVLRFADDRGNTLKPITITISPNGKMVTFVADAGSNNWHVYLAKLP